MLVNGANGYDNTITKSTMDRVRCIGAILPIYHIWYQWNMVSTVQISSLSKHGKSQNFVFIKYIRWAPCWPHEPCYQGMYRFVSYAIGVISARSIKHGMSWLIAMFANWFSSTIHCKAHRTNHCNSCGESLCMPPRVHGYCQLRVHNVPDW